MMDGNKSEPAEKKSNGTGGESDVGNNTSLNHLNVGMENLYATRAQADITVCIGDARINCHKAVLMAASPYFEAMFNSGMKEALDGEIKFQDMSASVFELVLEFIYTGKHIVTTDNAASLLEAASLLQINALFQLCEETLSRNLSLDNVLEAWRFASLHNAKRVVDAALYLILNQFIDFSTHDDFDKLTYPEVLHIIQDDRLIVNHEESVIEAVMKWGQSNKDRQQDLGNLIAQSRLCHLTLDHLFTLKKFFSSNIDSITARSGIDDAIVYKLIPSKRQSTSSVLARFRNSSPVEEVIAVVADDKLFAYSFLQNTWFTLAKLPLDPGGGMATCSTGNSLFVTGGCKANYDKFIEYIAPQNKWKRRSPLLRGRYCHAMVATSDSLFVLGGYEDTEDETYVPLSSVEKYAFEIGHWEQCGELTYSAADIDAVVINNKIYLFGGQLEQKRLSSSTEKDPSPEALCYNISTDACFSLRLPSLPPVHKAIQCDEITYLFSTRGKVVKFQTSSGSVTYEIICKTSMTPGYSLVQRNGVIHVVFDGFKATLNLETCETCMKEIPPFETDRFSSEKIVIHKKYLTTERQ